MSPDSTSKFLLERAIAHRGLHNAALGQPENSRVAFRAAAEAGYAIELDVRLSGDGGVVVFHDAGLSRLTGTRGAVAQTTAAELSRLTLLDTEETIPSLGDVLALVDGRVPVVVEMKVERNAELLGERVCEVIAGYGGRVALMSFEHDVLDAVQRCAPDTPRGFLFSLTGALLRTATDWVTEINDRVENLDFVGCDVRGLPYDPVPALRGRVFVLGWTITSPEAEKRARRWVDNIIFEGYDPGR